MKKMSLVFSLVISCTNIFSQPYNKMFEKFARVQDSLMTDAYNKKDTVAYKKQLALFLSGYNKLDSNNKKNFTGYYLNSFYNLACTYSLLDKKLMATDYFNKAVNAGFNDYYHILGDSDLNNIRTDEAFKKNGKATAKNK